MACSIANISFFATLLIPEGGFLWSPSQIQFAKQNCSLWEDVNCYLQSARSFLPSAIEFLETVKWQAQHHCDDSLSALLEGWIKAYPVRSRPGLPYTSWHDKKSIGKYLRFNSHLAFLHFHGLDNDTLINIDYATAPMEWPWSDSVDICKGEFRGWNCAFQIFNSSNSSHSSFWSSVRDNARDVVDRDTLFNIFRERPTHISQTLFFGKFVAILTEPSLLAQEYIFANLELLSRNTTNQLQIRKAKDLFKTYQDFGYDLSRGADDFDGENNNGSHPSVSMHVRHGDSCVKILNEIPDLEKETLIDPGTANRPCFSIDVYMKALFRLKKLYNVKRVFLSTDSEEMVRRAYEEPSFTWVIVASQRHIFDKKKTVDRVPARQHE